MVAGHRRFKKRFDAERQVFRVLAEEGQHPKVMWIGCSDSRVEPELITGAEPGELFVVRDVANVVPPFGPGGDALGAAIEFAVSHLEVSDIVVCGHTDCGGIKALDHPLDPVGMPHLARWLGLVRPAAAQAETSGETEEERLTVVIKANVLRQRENLRTYACVRDAETARALELHGWIYDLGTGDLLAFDDHSGTWVTIEELEE
jgi:carbonic anhydrase